MRTRIHMSSMVNHLSISLTSRSMNAQNKTAQRSLSGKMTVVAVDPAALLFHCSEPCGTSSLESEFALAIKVWEGSVVRRVREGRRSEFRG